MANKKEIKEIAENIVTQSLDDLMSDRFSIFAKYVIQDRAIPDAKDGLKPVQRRIIYSMYTNKNFYEYPTKKCAKIVGDVMGRFHPHGDSSIYDALARMSQSWKMSVPMIDFQGNNGSIDGDSPAAYRYTEARLSKYAELLIKNIDKKCIDFTLNFSDEEYEPLVLPAYVPNLFINGSEGIAVGLATKIPPHNLKEMCNAVIHRIKNPNCSLDEILEDVKGPDFPTGGIIYDDNGIKQIYENGRGKFELASKYTINEKSDSTEIVISEIPFGVEKQVLVYSIDKIRKDREVDGINDVKDLSSGDNIEIVIELKKGANPDIIIQYLLNKTQLKINYNANIVAICDNHPKTLSLLEYLDIYIKFLSDINVKSLNYDLQKAEARLHIVEGLIKAISIIDEIVELIRKSQNKEDARNKLMKTYSFSYEQAEAILNIRLYKLSHTDVQIYIDEKNELEKQIKKINVLLTNKEKFNDYLISFEQEAINTFNIERRTEISTKQKSVSINKRDLIMKESVYLVLTRDGYIKRSSIKSYKACEGQLPGLKEGDSIVLSQIVNTTDYVLAFTNLGNYMFIPVHEIIENRWKDEGKHINYLINLSLSEYIVKSIVVEDFNINVSIGLISKLGQIKKSKLKDFEVQRYSKPISCMKLSSNDELVDVAVLNNNSNLFVITENGVGTYFNEIEISRTGIKSGGVKAISTLRGSNLKYLIPITDGEKKKLIFLTNHEMYRVFDTSYLKLTARLGATQVVFKSFKSDPHSLVSYQEIKNKEEKAIFYGLLDDKSIFNIEIDDFHLTPIEKYCKKNVDAISDDRTITTVFNFEAEVVNKDFKVYDDIILEDSNKNSEDNNDEPHYEQISLFDDLGD